MSVPTRRFGRADAQVSILGLGGHHLGDAKTYEEAERIVHQAVDEGITFFDNCWEYHNGRAEEWMGRALKGRRDKVFLMTKVCVHGRGKEVAQQMLDESLRRLRTDRLDLWQIHGVSFEDEPGRYRTPGGMFEAFNLAKTAGKTRFVGFTGHKSPALHLAMLATNYPFDSIQMPLNLFDASFRSFTTQVLPEAQKRGLAVLGMKPMNGKADPVKKQVVTPVEALRYAMSLPGVTVTISGMDSVEVLRKNLDVASSFEPMTEDEMTALRARVAPLAADGRFEMYKVSLQFDNPEARKAHDYPLDPMSKEVTEALQAAEGIPGPK